MSLNMRGLLISAGIAGVAIGILSAIPILSLVNCLLCGWVWGGAIFAVWLYKRNQNGVIVSSGQGVVIGLVAALIGAVISWVLGMALGGAASAASLAPMLDQLPDEQTRQMVEQLVSSGGISIASLFIGLIINAIFGMIGGLIGAALIDSKPPSASA
ncbi:MAG: hypothetical protein RMN25_14475 [Anaerolineae bacterium]|nr:hypothetical protein [Thermoflexales bacterium]MDW8408976.1 hypothetical protein [Anaerolineae bacterium]